MVKDEDVYSYLHMKWTTESAFSFVEVIMEFIVITGCTNKINFTVLNIIFKEKTLRTKVVVFLSSFQMRAILNILFNFFPHHHLFDSFHKLAAMVNAEGAYLYFICDLMKRRGPIWVASRDKRGSGDHAGN